MQTLPVDRQKKLAPPVGSARSARRALAAAFASFTQTAGALETTYTKLQAEVGRLRYELENKNRSLAQSLEENQRMRNYLASIVEGLPCGVLVFDSGMNLRMINPAASRLLNTGSEEPSSPDASVPRLLGPLLAALPKEEFSHEQEWVVEGPQAERTIGVTRACIRAKGSGDDSILILRDLTEAKQLEHEREVLRRTQALAEVATLLAHEIRNPLGSLELFAGLLAEALANQAEVQPWINHVQSGLRSLAATVNNVLHFHSQPSAQLRPVDLLRLVGEMVEFLRPLVQQKEMHVEWRAPRASISILADPSRLQQAFLNLALNALRAMKPGGTLSVSVGQGQEGSCPAATVAFADQGAGIRAENLEKIFEPGFTTQCGSPGLGLAVTRKVIEQHGGTIRVESREGQGTTFTLTLPLAGQLSDQVIR
ncbi:MAG TPA: ATP-binding protein [Terriglobia bacterium]|nr:ATP-binding protein [Terriglobia bacterium]